MRKLLLVCIFTIRMYVQFLKANSEPSSPKTLKTHLGHYYMSSLLQKQNNASGMIIHVCLYMHKVSHHLVNPLQHQAACVHLPHFYGDHLLCKHDKKLNTRHLYFYCLWVNWSPYNRVYIIHTHSIHIHTNTQQPA